MTWDVIGHQWAVDLLRDHIRKDRVRHAYLFTGPDQIGKRTLALQFAQALNCTAPPSVGEFCGGCRTCEQVARQQHPDLHVIQPEEGSIKVDQIRELQRSVALAPYQSRYRITLFLDFHEATISASNALLKTLEEPPAQVVHLMTARDEESLLPTIVSRCENLVLRSVGLQELRRSLGETDFTQRDLAIGLSGGRPGRVLSIIAEPDILERRDQAINELMEVLSEKVPGRFGRAQRMARGRDLVTLREKNQETLEIWLSVTRDAFLAKLNSPQPLANPDREADIRHLAGGLLAESLIRSIQSIHTALTQIGYNANLQLTLENLMLDLPHLPAAERVNQVP